MVGFYSATLVWNLSAVDRGIEIMHRNKDAFLGEDGYTNRNDNAPANIFSLTSLVLAILKTISASPTRAIEYFQDNKNRAIRLLSGFH